MNDGYDLLRDSLNELKIEYDEKQIEMFKAYYDLLIDWNLRMNLTAITELDEVIIKHFVDSVLICKFIDADKDVSIIDVGTGAGFPGIPLKILNPDCRMVLLDSLNKRVRFLEETVSVLGLENVICLHGRAEDVARETKFRENFDYSVSRAVANLSTLSEYCIPFLKPGGSFISYKSDKSEEEINESKAAIKLLNSKIVSVKEEILPHSDIVRKFVIVKSMGRVDKKYPRKAGVPIKNPLGRKVVLS
ncbi:MAG: 16S rRNA (guanine(527)-N(7))-methyltransferase RsmG [Lachnospiraceae bacterium]|nr:16S rRNA (guanine(527)-N(7))-methyltransferase RsmG [Lachnospiraceae bacterium]